ncbi:hypothetical protein UlMin_036407 [Ulmus minor]
MMTGIVVVPANYIATVAQNIPLCSCASHLICCEIVCTSQFGFDIVISYVHMPDMDGFKFLEQIGLEMDLPVIMMSVDDGKAIVMKGVTHGACDYLIKPIHIEALKNIWQHVVWKNKNEWKDLEQSGSVEEGDRQAKTFEDAYYSSSAMPKKILELMNVPGLTRENFASHLQKYRLYLRRISGVSQYQTSLSSPFINPQDANFGSLRSLSGIDLQTLAVVAQHPAQSLATLQATGLGRSTAKSGPTGLGMPLVDQRNLFSFENPKMRFGEGQQLLSNKEMITNKDVEEFFYFFFLAFFWEFFSRSFNPENYALLNEF